MKFILIFLFPLQLIAQTNAALFKNVNIIDVKKGSVITHQNVLIEGNRIKSISSKALPAKGATIINATDKYLIPGLWDMHVHLFNNVSQRPPNEYYFPLFIANGITGVRDMWTKETSMPQVVLWRSQVEEKSNVRPRIGTVGALVDGLRHDIFKSAYLQTTNKK